MKLEDMILVTESRKGTETIFLLNLHDYLGMVVKACEDSALDAADAISQLYATREQEDRYCELYFSANVSSQARFCAGECQLRVFLSGMGEREENQEKSVFDSLRCSEGCLEVLKAYGIGTDGKSLFNALHYKAVGYDFRQGETLRNLNGSNYRVLVVLNERNLLLMSQSDGQYILADNTVMYERTPKEGAASGDSIIRGIEWGHGTYLGRDLMKIDLQGIMQEYGTIQKVETIDECRAEARRQFAVYKWLSKDERLEFAVKWAAESSMADAFGTTDEWQFETWLQKGNYDMRIKAQEERRLGEERENSGWGGNHLWQDK